MVARLEEAGLLFVGRDETGERMEVVELQDNPSGHPFYVAAQVRRGGLPACHRLACHRRAARAPRRQPTTPLPLPRRRAPTPTPTNADAQFHPEFKSRPGRASPLFLGFILAAGKRLNSYLTSRATPAPSPMSTPIKLTPAGSVAGPGQLPGGGAAGAAGDGAAAALDKLALGTGASPAAARGDADKENAGGSGAQAALFVSG